MKIQHPNSVSHYTFITTSVVFLSSFILLLFGLDRGHVSIYDEAIIAYGAERVLNGDVPYKDFWALYSPAQFWIVAGLFKLFGSSLLVERMWDIFIRSLVGLFCFLIAKRLSTSRYAVIAWILSLVWLWNVGFYGYPLLPAALFIMISAYYFVQFILEPAVDRRLFWAGVCLGISALFRHDIGFYGFFAEAASLIFFYFKGNKERLGTFGFLNLRKNLLLLSFGAVLAGLPAAIYLISQVPISELWSQLFIWPASIYPETRTLPYPSLIDPFQDLLNSYRGDSFSVWRFTPIASVIPFYFHFVVVGIAIIALARFWQEKETSSDWYGKKLSILFLVILICVVFLKSLVRPHHVHLIHVMVLALCLAVVLLYLLLKRQEKIMSSIIVIAIVGMSVQPMWKIAVWVDKAFRSEITSSAAAGDQGIISGIKGFYWTLMREGNGPVRARYFHIASDQAAAIDYIQQHVPIEERIFVGNSRHDKAFVNDIMFYFLSERHSATKFHELDPGSTTTSEVQTQIIRQLIGNHVNYVILWSGAENVHEPNKSAESSGVKILDEFLATKYQEVAHFGNYRIRKKNEL